MTDRYAAQPIRRARADDKAQVCITLATAFAEGPVAEWLVPDATLRLPAYVEYSHSVYDVAIARGLVHTTPTHAGAAVWFPHPLSAATTADPSPAQPQGRMAQLDAFLARLQPNIPHHHLAFLGVDPLHQRRGLGSALLKHHHHTLDMRAIPAFLVATSTGSRDLYLRHGYLVRQEQRLPDGPPLWAMWREPRSS